MLVLEFLFSGVGEFCYGVFVVRELVILFFNLGRFWF